MWVWVVGPCVPSNPALKSPALFMIRDGGGNTLCSPHLGERFTKGIRRLCPEIIFHDFYMGLVEDVLTSNTPLIGN